MSLFKDVHAVAASTSMVCIGLFGSNFCH